jgi:transposase InsO family protein
MPWQEQSRMSMRAEFVTWAHQEGANITEQSRRYGISRKTGYKWLARAAAGETAFTDRSHRPHRFPSRTAAAVEDAVLALRTEHPAWGGRKLHQTLQLQGLVQPPAPSTITAILRRHDRLGAAVRPSRDYQRFVADEPNDLWQIDFMGQPTMPTGKIHPLTVLDDHSRFALLVAACAAEQAEIVAAHVLALCDRYGLPRRILTDNGPPWGTAGTPGLTALETSWLRLGIVVSHGRPLHPQTQGKVERLHRTIWAEVRGIHDCPNLDIAQHRFEVWRHGYNHQRPHEALDYAVPASRYRPSPRPLPTVRPPLVYGPEDAVRKVQADGAISFGGQDYFISHGLHGQPVAVRRTSEEGRWTVWYGQRQVATRDLERQH